MAAAVLFGGLVLALAGCGGGSDSGAVATVTVTTTETTSAELTTTTPTDLYGDTTDTTDAGEETAVVGQGVDQTCDDLVELFSQGLDANLARGGDSVSEIESIATAYSELAAKAPAEPSTDALLAGEPRDSLIDLGQAFDSYAALLTELGLEPGPDALLEPRIDEALEGQAAAATDLGLWIDERCSDDVKSRIMELGS